MILMQKRKDLFLDSKFDYNLHNYKDGFKQRIDIKERKKENGNI